MKILIGGGGLTGVDEVETSTIRQIQLNKHVNSSLSHLLYNIIKD